MANLYIVATPIGNLEDMTLRGLRILKEVDLILCEDTRVTKKLLDHFGIDTPTMSYHQHSKLKKVNHIVELLKEGKDIALVSDAGTPGISDPGGKLVEEVSKVGLEVYAVPGPSAVAAVASISGIAMEKFLFMGFPPQKKKRKKFFEEVASSKYPVILYESPHRVMKTLAELEEIDPGLQAVVGRELTKKFDTDYRGTIGEVASKIENDKIKGEYVIIISR